MVNFYLYFKNKKQFEIIFLLCFFFIYKGKALLLLNEDSFKQRSPRSGDILHKALQQHRAMLKSIHYQSKELQRNK
jgi:hypothetical protein